MAIKSPLKWVGSKARLMPQLLQHLPEGKRLVEPFAGSCSVMLNTDYDEYLIADVNPDLVMTYRAMSYHTGALLQELEALFSAGQVGSDEARTTFYYIAREKFNLKIGLHDPVYRAALFIYLNRFGYGGMCRYNRLGQFNTPCGKYKSPYFPQAGIEAFAEKSKRAIFITAGYEETLGLARAGDVVYCDPPYIPVNTAPSFTGYHTDGFSRADQESLALNLWGMARRGVPVVASNSDSILANALYNNFTRYQLKAPRSIGARHGAPVSEFELLAIGGVA